MGLPENSNKQSSTKVILGIFSALIVLGCVNFLSYKVMYSAYGERYSFFVSQGVNLLFVIYGGMIVYPMQLFTDQITKEMTDIPKYKFMIMGLLDCFGTFFTAMGAVYTPGQFQTLLNQCLIPLTMLASYVFLKIKYTNYQLMGALTILIGAAAVVVPSFLKSEFTSDQLRVYACVVYVSSNIPMACSAIYKERAFKSYKVNVYYLTQWVSIYQLFFGFILAPLQMIPGIGSKNGISMHEIIESFKGGWECCFSFNGEDQCAGKHTFLLIVGYCFINFAFNTTGLFMTKHASAVMNSITFAVLLPLTTMLFSFKFLGPYQEHFSYFTAIGLVIILIGVGLYHFFSKEMLQQRNAIKVNENSPVLPRILQMENASDTVPSSIQERIVGMQFAHRPSNAYTALSE